VGPEIEEPEGMQEFAVQKKEPEEQWQSGFQKDAIGREAQGWVRAIDPTDQRFQTEREGWLLNHVVSDTLDESTKQRSQCLTLIFFAEDGDTFSVNIYHKPYFYVVPQESAIAEVEQGLKSSFGSFLADISTIEKEDLDMPGHLSGKTRTLLKLSFHNVQDLLKVRNELLPAVRRNRSTAMEFGSELATEEPDDERRGKKRAGKSSYSEKVVDLREYDVHYHVRVAIDLDIFVGKWYKISATKTGEVHVKKIVEDRINMQPRILAWDIECTKAPLKFPVPDVDHIYMISWMLDGQGFLLINREIVSEDIENFEYTPKPEYEGKFTVWNVPDEQALIRQFFDIIKQQKPHVMVTYNGDYFDFPFIEARAKIYGIDMNSEIGFRDNGSGEYVSPFCPHLDCLYWVNRDSYLPQGSRGLKAVSKYKLGYDPVEIHHEEMLPMAREDPKRMAAYSVSDAVATYYLYMKYVNPFIFSLCTIIPMRPDEVLRKGSGTCCEHLLMVQADEKNVVFPNKTQARTEAFYNGHLLDQETYVGGHVEALRSGLFRADVPIEFKMEADKFQELIDKVDGALHFAITQESKLKMEDVTNYDEVKADIVSRLEGLRDKPNRNEEPHILHLDVSAMYPNIILTNRLQPPAMVNPEICAACPHNRPESDCKRPMKWIWRGERFVLNRGEYNRVKQQLQQERFDDKRVQEVKTKMAGKKDWKFGKKRQLIDKPKGGKGGKGKGKGKFRQMGAYRQLGKAAKEEFEKKMRESALEADYEQNWDEGDGKSAFSELRPDEQQSMIKKRVTEYCRAAYKKIHATEHETREATVCQRENSFFIDTVRQFRDKRYVYKGLLKKWKGLLENAKAGKEGPGAAECAARATVYDSLQLAHKCILNSFYGYVMRKGSRWYSMEMAAAVTYCGATLITMARELVDKIGVSLELDTDGIWCCLPGSFPMDYNIKTKTGKGANISYPCVMLNKDTWDKYTNHQYQDKVGANEYKVRSECSILFEVDGPYKAMVLPASKEEGVGIKKRYAVFEFCGKVAELKGFELKRRGELQIVKDFQATIFSNKSPWLYGGSLKDAYKAVADIAHDHLRILNDHGGDLETEELIEKIQESCSMSRRLEDYAKDQKGLALTCARRIADFLGADMVRDKGLNCTFIISKMPPGRPVTSRPIPIQIFSAPTDVRRKWLTKWCEDPSLGRQEDIDIRDILDWEYYTARLASCIQKIVTIPAAYQNVPNPVPSIEHPTWLARKVRELNSKFKQSSLTGFLAPREKRLADLEDVTTPPKQVSREGVVQINPRKRGHAEAPPVPVAEATPAGYAVVRKKYGAAVWAPETKISPGSAAHASSCLGAMLEDPQLGGWLKGAVMKWKDQAKKREEGVSEPPGEKARKVEEKGGLMRMLRTAQEAIELSEWEVLEVRRVPTDPIQVVRLLVAVGESVKQLNVVVPRTVFLHRHTAMSTDAKSGYGATSVQAILPRCTKRHHLYSLPVVAKTKESERETLAALWRDRGCEGIYESNVPSVLRSLIKLGGRCKVNLKKHRTRKGLLPSSFHIDDLEPIPCASISSMTGFERDLSAPSPSKYLDQAPTPVFVFECAVSGRGLVCLVLPHTNAARVAYWKTGHVPGKEESLRWTDLWSEARKLSDESHSTDMDELMEATRQELGDISEVLAISAAWASDEAGAWRLIDAALKQDAAIARRLVLLSQTQLQLQTVYKNLPSASAMPTLRVPFCTDDLLEITHSLQWARDAGRRALFRYLSVRPYFVGLVRQARFAGLPLVNVCDDTQVNVFDTLYARLLSHHSHVLWCSGAAGEPDVNGGPGGGEWENAAVQASVRADADRPRAVSVPGSYHTWVVEIAIQGLEVAAVVHGQALMDAETPGSLAFDASVLSHFQLLRELITSLYFCARKDSKDGSIGDELLSEMWRWLRSPTSLLYEPELAGFVSQLSRRLFGAFLGRIRKLGGRVVYADYEKVVVATPKSDFPDALRYSKYLLNSLEEQTVAEANVFALLQPEIMRWWSDFLFLGPDDHVGMSVHYEEGMLDVTDKEAGQFAEEAQVEDRWDISERFPPATKKRFRTFVMEFLAQLHKNRLAAVSKVRLRQEGGAQGCLASQEEQIRQLCFAEMRKAIDEHFTPRLLKEVHNITAEEMKRRVVERESGQVSHDGVRNLEIDYVVSVCHVLGQEQALEEAVRQMKYTVLQISEVSPHSAAALWKPREKGVKVDSAVCRFCHGTSDIQLLPGGLAEQRRLRKETQLASDLWKCPTCQVPYDKVLVESQLLRDLDALLLTQISQEVRCSLCRLPQEYDCQTTCSCGGEWEFADVQTEETSAELRRYHAAAQIHQLAWLEERTASLLKLL